MSETTTAAIPEADLRAYEGAYESVALYASEARGRLLMRDRDRAALLHRLSTNQIERLATGQGTDTVLTTPIGRIIDLLSVYALDDALLLVTSPGRGPAIFGHLRKNIFFNDKVKLEDATATLGQLAIYGPQAAALLSAHNLPGAELPPRGIVVTEWAGAPLYVAACSPIGGVGFWLIAPPATLADLGATLRAAGAHTLDEATYEVLRVEAGHSAFGHELSQEYIPLETGLWDAVSFNKGCYVGQEIIARMESRGRLAKRLRGLRFAALPDLTSPDDADTQRLSAAPLARLDAEGKEAGDLTSVVRSPRYGLIGLGYVRTAHAETGARLMVAGVAVEVVDLPFGA